MAACIQPFYNAWNWISDKFVGHSPSELGLGIVKGIESVSNAVFGFLTLPFRKAFDYIKKIPVIGKLFSAAGNMVASLTNDIVSQVETKANAIVEISNIDDLRDTIDLLTASVSKLATILTDNTNRVMSNEKDKTADKVQELIDLLRNGAIAVHLDGRKVSSALTNIGR